MPSYIMVHQIQHICISRNIPLLKNLNAPEVSEELECVFKEDTCLACLNETEGKFIFNTMLILCIAVIGHCCFATFGFVCSNRFTLC
jgi:hypothetical protein